MRRLVAGCSGRSPSGRRNRAIIATLYRCGLRSGELLALDPDHLDTETALLRVGTGARERSVPVDAGALDLLEGWLEARRERGIDPRAPLFCTLRGDRLRPSYLRAMLTREARRAGIRKPVSADLLRRTLAAELAREGYPLGLIQAQLGHTTPGSTRRLVSDVASDTVFRALRRRSRWDVSLDASPQRGRGASESRDI